MSSGVATPPAPYEEENDDSESEFSNDSDSCSLTASKVPTYRPNNYNGGSKNKHGNFASPQKK